MMLGQMEHKRHVILLIGDDLAALGKLSADLERHGFQTLVAPSDAAGLEQVRHTQPDLMVLDVSHPARHEPDIRRFLISDPATHDIPLMIMTTHPEEAAQLHPAEGGMIDYLIKPYRDKELLIRVVTLLRFQQRLQGLQAQHQELYAANQALAIELAEHAVKSKRAAQHLALRSGVTRIVSEAETRQAAVLPLLETICSAMAWDLGELWRVDSHANCLRWEGAWYPQALDAATAVEARRTLTFPPGSDLPGQIWASGQPQLLDAGQSKDARLDALDLEQHIGCPIRGGSTVLGVLVFWSRVACPTDPELLTVLADVGSQIGLFFERMRAEERLRQYVRRVVDAQEAERAHIARELHDEIGHALALIKMNVRAVRRLAHESDLVPRLEQSLTIIEEALQHVRTLALDLRPSLLDDLGLVTTLRWYVERYAKWTGLDVEVTVESFEARIPRPLETVCFRVAQEALSNVARHAQAQSVRIKLWQREEAVHMLIRDDGVGFDVLGVQERTIDGTSIGLLGMEDRVMLAGGQLVIESAAGRGTIIWVRLPLAQATTAGNSAQGGA